MDKPNILFVCSVNRMRSATAARIFASDERFYVDSAGTDKNAAVVLEEESLEWADFVLVMEQSHRKKISQMFPALSKTSRIISLNIPDNYDFMDPDLIDLLREKVEHVYRTEINPAF